MSKIDFQDGRHGSYSGFSIQTVLAFFDLQDHLGFPIDTLLAIF